MDFNGDIWLLKHTLPAKECEEGVGKRCVESLAAIACFVLSTLPANVPKPPLRLGLPNPDLRKPTDF